MGEGVGVAVAVGVGEGVSVGVEVAVGGGDGATHAASAAEISSAARAMLSILGLFVAGMSDSIAQPCARGKR